jgi:hypothetical protein
VKLHLNFESPVPNDGCFLIQSMREEKLEKICLLSHDNAILFRILIKEILCQAQDYTGSPHLIFTRSGMN